MLLSTWVGGRCKTGQIADYPAPQGQDGVVPVQAGGNGGVVQAPDPRQALGALAGGDHRLKHLPPLRLQGAAAEFPIKGVHPAVADHQQPGRRNTGGDQLSQPVQGTGFDADPAAPLAAGQLYFQILGRHGLLLPL